MNDYGALFAMRSWTRRYLHIAFLSMAPIPILSGCFIFIGDRSPVTKEIQAFARQQTKVEAARTVDEMMFRIGARRASQLPTESQDIAAWSTISINFTMQDGRTYVGASIEGRPRGVRICIDIVGPMGNDELEANTKADIVRLETALIDSFGKGYVAAAPCSSEPYWPVANGP